MDYKCFKCKEAILHHPLMCEACGTSMCLHCSNDEFDVPFCDDCIDLQTVQLDIAVSVKCSVYDCNDWAVVTQPCISAETHDNPILLSKKAVRKLKAGKTLPKKELKECGQMAIYCKNHISTCLVCTKVLCPLCAMRKICWQDGKLCGICKKIHPMDNLSFCEVCGKCCCVECIDGDRMEKWAGYIMCRSHRKYCRKCRSDKYEVPTFKCQMIGCDDYSCIRTCQFKSLLKENIYVCHGHIAMCLMCANLYPLTNSKKIKFRDGFRIDCCSNCYGPNLDSMNTLMICLRRLNIPIPKDVLGHIFKFLIDGQIL